MTRSHAHRPRSPAAPWTAALLALLLATAGCSALSYVGYRLAPDAPENEDATIALAGLQRPVRVLLDDWGVFHVEAETEADLLRAVGFMHGRDRFFQMDTLRRFARGRLSELVGEQQLQFGSSVDLDATMRGWGFDAQVTDDATSLDAEHRGLMLAYVDGVNAALRRHPPIEYRLLDVEPEPWTLADCFAVGRLVAWSISHNWGQELSRLLLAVHGGWQRAAAIYPHDPWPGPAAVQLDAPARALPPGVVAEARALFPARSAPRGAAAEHPGPRLDIGAFAWASNAWVVGGGRTPSGKPLLANDPHMSHTLPSLMVQQHLRCGELDVIGVTAPGLPYVLIGHNRDVAWGLTSAVGDAIDLYLERPLADDPDRVQGPAGPEPLTAEKLTILVRRGHRMEPRRVTVRRTPRGPLVNDLYPGLLPDDAPWVSLRWASDGVARSIAALRRANRAASVAELRRAMLEMVTPINSVMAADSSGTIALFPTGRLPRRPAHRGTFPVPAWVADYDWDGFIPPEQLPLFSAGADGAFAHGNSLMFDPARGPVLLQIDSAPAYRLERIQDLLRSSERVDVDRYQRMQRDVVLYRARRLLPALRAELAELRGLLPREDPARRLLAEWDGSAGADSAAAAVFFTTYREAFIAAVRDEVDARGLEYLLGQRYFINAVDLWFADADHPVWDDRRTAARERRGDVLRAAFRRAVQQLRASQGGSAERWRWGRLHRQQSRHPFGGKLPAFNLPRWESLGGPDAVWKSHLDLANADQPFAAVAGPVYRMIVDLADPAHGWWIIDTGSSGWPCSEHYGDQHRLWQRGQYAPMVMDWDELERDAAAVLALQPK